MTFATGSARAPRAVSAARDAGCSAIDQRRPDGFYWLWHQVRRRPPSHCHRQSDVNSRKTSLTVSDISIVKFWPADPGPRQTNGWGSALRLMLADSYVLGGCACELLNELWFTATRCAPRPCWPSFADVRLLLSVACIFLCALLNLPPDFFAHYDFTGSGLFKFRRRQRLSAAAAEMVQ